MDFLRRSPCSRRIFHRLQQSGRAVTVHRIAMELFKVCQPDSGHMRKPRELQTITGIAASTLGRTKDIWTTPRRVAHFSPPQPDCHLVAAVIDHDIAVTASTIVTYKLLNWKLGPGDRPATAADKSGRHSGRIRLDQTGTRGGARSLRGLSAVRTPRVS